MLTKNVQENRILKESYKNKFPDASSLQFIYIFMHFFFFFLHIHGHTCWKFENRKFNGKREELAWETYDNVRILFWVNKALFHGQLDFLPSFKDRWLWEHHISLGKTESNYTVVFQVMASDGLWDVVSNAEVVSIIRDTVKEPGMCSKRLATEAAERGSKDNITVIVIFLRPVSTAERIY